MNSESKLKPTIIATLIAVFGFFLGIFLLFILGIPLMLFVGPLIAYSLIYYKFKEVFWTSILLSMAAIVLIVTFSIIILFYTGLGDIILHKLTDIIFL